jgi:lipopolysaccharide biosynthesis regulator YciM
MNKSLTIQEIETLDTNNYKEFPEELIPLAKQLLKIKKFEKGIEILEKSIHLAIEKNDKDETNINCAKFYTEYAEALIRKIIESQDLLAAPMEENGETTTKNNTENNNINNENHNENKDNNISNNIGNSNL